MTEKSGLIHFRATDGESLSGTWFTSPTSSRAPGILVVVVGGAGIPAILYRGLACYLADHGAAVLTFDYRGIGASRQGSLRDFRAGIEDWGTRDLSAALALARTAYPGLPINVIAHSIGTLLVGAARGVGEVSRAVFFGPHTAYYGDYRASWRLPLYALWHLFMPAVTKIVGYFPARALGLGQDLPRQVALDWARRRQPELVANRGDHDRFAAILCGYGDLQARTLAISVSDDAFAPPAAGQRLLGLYPNINASHEVITPASQGERHLGHFAFIRRPASLYFWDRAMAWLLPSSEDGRASHQTTSRGVPPSGTKEDVLAGSTTPLT